MGVKRSIEMTLSELPAGAPEHFVVSVPGEAWRGTCNGDSGGAGLALGDGRDVQVGVHARAHNLVGDEWECGEGEQTSVPYFYDTFVSPGGTFLLSQLLFGSSSPCGSYFPSGPIRCDDVSRMLRPSWGLARSAKKSALAAAETARTNPRIRTPARPR